MPRMSRDEIAEFLSGPLVGVLSVSRGNRGPIAVPVWFLYRDGEFYIMTSANSLHGRIMQRTSRATVTVHREEYGDTASVETYVIAEGPIVFTDRDVVPHVYEVRAKYYRNDRSPEWIEQPIVPEELQQRVAVLTPDTLSGYEWRAAIDPAPSPAAGD